MTPGLAVIVVSYNTAHLLRECLTAILDHSGDAEIVVVDNASADGSAAMVQREFPSVRLIAQARNTGFGAANNVGVQAAAAEFVMLLNSDAILLEDTGRALVDYLRAHPDVICAAPRIVLPNGERQARVFGNQPSLWRIATQALYLSALFPGSESLAGIDGREPNTAEATVGWISGVCMVMRRTDFLAASGFDPEIFMYCEDVDLCGRLARPGSRIVRVDRFAVRHYGGASSPTLAAELRNAVWVQRNLLRVVRRRSGRGAAYAARLLISVGLILRVAAGLAAVPKRGVRNNRLLRTSWLRMRDLVGARPAAAG